MPRAAPAQSPPPPDLKLGRGLEFLRLLWQVDHGLLALSKRMETVLGVTGPQRMTIRIIGRFPRIAAGDLAAWLHLHPSTLTGIIRRLEKRGMIAKYADPMDARRIRYDLTRAGRRVNALREGTVEAAISAALASVPASKVDIAREVLETIAAHVTPAE